MPLEIIPRPRWTELVLSQPPRDVLDRETLTALVAAPVTAAYARAGRKRKLIRLIILTTTVLMVSLVLATDWLVYTGVIRLSKMGAAGWTRMRAHYSREAREERRAERAEKVRAELADAVEPDPQELADMIRRHELTEVVIAGETPGGHKPVFTRAMALADGDPRARYDAWRDEARTLAFILAVTG